MVIYRFDSYLIMTLHHTFNKKNGFDLKKLNFDRGIFAIESWWLGKPGYENTSEWEPNEFGDTVVKLEIDENVKTFEAGEQTDALEKIFGKNSAALQKIAQQFDLGNLNRDEWPQVDALIGKSLKKMGYELIHYTHDEMYGDTWAIIDPSVIKAVQFEND
jgi:hypothetical protein